MSGVAEAERIVIPELWVIMTASLTYLNKSSDLCSPDRVVIPLRRVRQGRDCFLR